MDFPMDFPTRPKAGRGGKWPAPGPADLRHFDDFPFKKLPDAEERGTYGHHAGVGKCPILGILDITFKYLLEIISPILG